MYNKKCISPVVATALLLVVAVVAVVGFQGWFGTFSSNLFSKTETQSNQNIGNTQIEGVVGYNLYFKNGKSGNITIDKIKVGTTDCNITSNLSVGISEIDLGTCLDNLYTSTPEVVVYTSNGIYSEKVYLKDIVIRQYSGCSLNGGDVAHLGSFLFYNTSSLSYDGNCSLNSLSRNCFDGVYSGDSNFSYISCSLAGQDIIPDSFSFTNQTGVNLSTIISSNTVIPTGYEGTISVTITGDGTPEFSIAGGSWTTSSTITLGQNISLRLNSSNSNNISNIAQLNIGNYSVNWSVETKGPLAIDYLIVAGGGAGGYSINGNRAGGGGAGGFISQNNTFILSGNYTIIIGLGGICNASSGISYNGENSSFLNFTAIGGGYGGKETGPSSLPSIGGSGGGAGAFSGIYEIGANGTIAQGNAGGNLGSNYVSWGLGGGGGGAGGPGLQGNNAGSRTGGLALVWSGNGVAYAGGGAGHGDAASTASGGGGAGIAGVSASVNSGSGGGGASGNGGSGIVVIRYLGSQVATGGNVINSSGGYTYHYFTSSGNFTLS